MGRSIRIRSTCARAAQVAQLHGEDAARKPQAQRVEDDEWQAPDHHAVDDPQ